MLLHQKSEGLQGNFGTFHFIICQCGLQRARILCRLFLLLAKNKIADHRCMTKTFFFLQIFIIFSQRTFNSSWRVKKTKTTSLEKKRRKKSKKLLLIVLMTYVMKINLHAWLQGERNERDPRYKFKQLKFHHTLWEVIILQVVFIWSTPATNLRVKMIVGGLNFASIRFSRMSFRMSRGRFG